MGHLGLIFLLLLTLGATLRQPIVSAAAADPETRVELLLHTSPELDGDEGDDADDHNFSLSSNATEALIAGQDVFLNETVVNWLAESSLNDTAGDSLGGSTIDIGMTQEVVRPTRVRGGRRPSAKEIRRGSETKVEEEEENVSRNPLEDILPLVTFDCDDRHEGYYADEDFDCRVFHFCTEDGVRHTYMCGGNAKFNQKIMTCDYSHNAVCNESAAYYHVNEMRFQKDVQHSAGQPQAKREGPPMRLHLPKGTPSPAKSPEKSPLWKQYLRAPSSSSSTSNQLNAVPSDGKSSWQGEKGSTSFSSPPDIFDNSEHLIARRGPLLSPERDEDETSSSEDDSFEAAPVVEKKESSTLVKYSEEESIEDPELYTIPIAALKSINILGLLKPVLEEQPSSGSVVFGDNEPHFDPRTDPLLAELEQEVEKRWEESGERKRQEEEAEVIVMEEAINNNSTSNSSLDVLEVVVDVINNNSSSILEVESSQLQATNDTIESETPIETKPEVIAVMVLPENDSSSLQMAVNAVINVTSQPQLLNDTAQTTTTMTPASTENDTAHIRSWRRRKTTTVRPVLTRRPISRNPQSITRTQQQNRPWASKTRGSQTSKQNKKYWIRTKLIRRMLNKTLDNDNSEEEKNIDSSNTTTNASSYEITDSNNVTSQVANESEQDDKNITQKVMIVLSTAIEPEDIELIMPSSEDNNSSVQVNLKTDSASTSVEDESSGENLSSSNESSSEEVDFFFPNIPEAADNEKFRGKRRVDLQIIRKKETVHNFDSDGLEAYRALSHLSKAGVPHQRYREPLFNSPDHTVSYPDIESGDDGSFGSKMPPREEKETPEENNNPDPQVRRNRQRLAQKTEKIERNDRRPLEFADSSEVTFVKEDVREEEFKPSFGPPRRRPDFHDDKPLIRPGRDEGFENPDSRRNNNNRPGPKPSDLTGAPQSIEIVRHSARPSEQRYLNRRPVSPDHNPHHPHHHHHHSHPPPPPPHHNHHHNYHKSPSQPLLDATAKPTLDNVRTDQNPQGIPPVLFQRPQFSPVGSIVNNLGFHAPVFQLRDEPLRPLDANNKRQVHHQGVLRPNKQDGKKPPHVQFQDFEELGVQQFHHLFDVNDHRAVRQGSNPHLSHSRPIPIHPQQGHHHHFQIQHQPPLEFHPDLHHQPQGPPRIIPQDRRPNIPQEAVLQFQNQQRRPPFLQGHHHSFGGPNFSQNQPFFLSSQFHGAPISSLQEGPPGTRFSPPVNLRPFVLLLDEQNGKLNEGSKIKLSNELSTPATLTTPSTVIEKPLATKERIPQRVKVFTPSPTTNLKVKEETQPVTIIHEETTTLSDPTPTPNQFRRVRPKLRKNRPVLRSRPKPTSEPSFEAVKTVASEEEIGERRKPLKSSFIYNSEENVEESIPAVSPPKKQKVSSPPDVSTESGENFSLESSPRFPSPPFNIYYNSDESFEQSPENSDEGGSLERPTHFPQRPQRPRRPPKRRPNQRPNHPSTIIPQQPLDYRPEGPLEVVTTPMIHFNNAGGYEGNSQGVFQQISTPIPNELFLGPPQVGDVNHPQTKFESYENAVTQLPNIIEHFATQPSEEPITEAIPEKAVTPSRRVPIRGVIRHRIPQEAAEASPDNNILDVHTRRRPVKPVRINYHVSGEIQPPDTSTEEVPVKIPRRRIPVRQRIPPTENGDGEERRPPLRRLPPGVVRHRNVVPRPAEDNAMEEKVTEEVENSEIRISPTNTDETNNSGEVAAEESKGQLETDVMTEPPVTVSSTTTRNPQRTRVRTPGIRNRLRPRPWAAGAGNRLRDSVPRENAEFDETRIKDSHQDFTSTTPASETTTTRGFLRPRYNPQNYRSNNNRLRFPSRATQEEQDKEESDNVEEQYSSSEEPAKNIRPVLRRRPTSPLFVRNSNGNTRFSSRYRATTKEPEESSEESEESAAFEITTIKPETTKEIRLDPTNNNNNFNALPQPVSLPASASDRLKALYRKRNSLLKTRMTSQPPPPEAGSESQDNHAVEGKSSVLNALRSGGHLSLTTTTTTTTTTSTTEKPSSGESYESEEEAVTSSPTIEEQVAAPSEKFPPPPVVRIGKSTFQPQEEGSVKESEVVTERPSFTSPPEISADVTLAPTITIITTISSSSSSSSNSAPSTTETTTVKPSSTTTLATTTIAEDNTEVPTTEIPPSSTEESKLTFSFATEDPILPIEALLSFTRRESS